MAAEEIETMPVKTCSQTVCKTTNRVNAGQKHWCFMCDQKRHHASSAACRGKKEREKKKSSVGKFQKKKKSQKVREEVKWVKDVDGRSV